MAYRIRELREKKKLTQEQLAQMSGVSRRECSDAMKLRCRKRTSIVLLQNPL